MREWRLCEGGIDGCRKPAAKGRRMCSRCHMRQWRTTRPLQAAFATLRDHARARGIEFTITLPEFRKFVLQSGYLTRRGNAGACLTVDRVDNLRGYVPGNLQPLTRSENSVKRAKFDACRMRAGYSWREAA